MSLPVLVSSRWRHNRSCITVMGSMDVTPHTINTARFTTCSKKPSTHVYRVGFCCTQIPGGVIQGCHEKTFLIMSIIMNIMMLPRTVRHDWHILKMFPDYPFPYFNNIINEYPWWDSPWNCTLIVPPVSSLRELHKFASKDHLHPHNGSHGVCQLWKSIPRKLKIEWILRDQ